MNREDLIKKAKELALLRVRPGMDTDEKVDLLEMAMMELLDVQIMKPSIGRVGTATSGGFEPTGGGKWLMGDDPRLPKMPSKPTMIDFFNYRFKHDTMGSNHLLQSGKLARVKGRSEKIVLACLLHDIAIVGLVRSDHGHWAAQMIEPYVDPEVTWAVKHHQALRYRPDPAYGYEYPKKYVQWFGEDFEPAAHTKAEWEYCANHKWYDSAMQVVVNDLYAFDPNEIVRIEEFTDIIERNFRQPPEGLGFDGSPSAHMWRTMIWPNNFL
jgi:predicted HD phosphohydrolase